MHARIRPYATAGVALVGAGAIAVAPIAPPAPTVAIAAPTISSAAVLLTQYENPIEAWLGLFEHTAASFEGLGEVIANDPAPILTRLLENQAAYGEVLEFGFEQFAEGLSAAAEALPEVLEDAAEQFSEGNVLGAVQTLVAGTLGGLLIGALPLLQAVSVVGTHWGENVGNMTAAFFHPNALLGLATAFINPILSFAAAVGDVGQALSDAAIGGDLLAAGGILLSAPALLTSAVLNGWEPPNTSTFGILTPSSQGEACAFCFGGSIQSFLNVEAIIADAIEPFVSPFAAEAATAASESSPDPATVPDPSADAVALTTSLAAETGTGGGSVTASVQDGEDNVADASANYAEQTESLDDADGADDSDTAPKKPLKRESLKATPGESGLKGNGSRSGATDTVVSIDEKSTEAGDRLDTSVDVKAPESGDDAGSDGSDGDSDGSDGDSDN